ncbi:RNA recognition motif domain-containing protein [Hirschfeldia incana]|nr:RNA recognition motif domain-containing protein [Hirschfeldia incana]
MAETGYTLLYVGDIELTVTDSALFDAFYQAGYVSSARICRDLFTGRSLGYGYVSFHHSRDAHRALEMMNGTAINGKDVRVIYHVHDPSLLRKPRNLEESIDHKALYDTFSMFGSILRFKLATNNDTVRSKGFGFVQYETEESALKAIGYLNGMLLNDEAVYVGPFLQKDSPYDKGFFTDIYVKNLSKSLADEDLEKIFGEFGPTTNCLIIREGEVRQGKSRGYGFVSFEKPEDAEKAVEALNGKKFEDKEWYVTKSKMTYKNGYNLKRGLKYSINISQGLNYVCVKKLHKSVTDETLKVFFSPYGTITSCKVMRDSSGVSRGSGFVAFLKPEEAFKAMEEINGKMKIRKQVYVDLAISLANATPEQQRTMLGESLYPMVEQLEPESAAKITGMLLEMDQTKALHLLESFAALESKVTEAMEILRTVKDQQQQQYRGGSESASDSKSSISTDSKPSLSSSFISPKLRSLACVNRGGSESASDSNPSLSTDSNPSLSSSFISPKPKSVVRVNSRLSIGETSVVLLTNRFDSLKEVGQ